MSFAPSTSGIKPRLSYCEDVATLPVTAGLDGIVRSANIRRADTQLEVLKSFKSGEAEVALLPTSDVLTTPGCSIIPTAAVTCFGAARMMLLLSKTIPSDINRVLVDVPDYGAELLGQLLVYKKLGTRPEFVRSPKPLDPARYDLLAEDGFDAYLLCGHHGFFVRKEVFVYTLDLTLAWYEMTKLPFATLCWVRKRGVDVQRVAMELGDVARRNDGSAEVVERASSRFGITQGGITAVYRKAIITHFDGTVMQALRRYAMELQQARIAAVHPIEICPLSPTRKV